MITFQENTHFSQALPCTREEFWEQVKKPSTRWRIDMRRAIIAAVEASKTQGAVALHNLLQNSEYQKFLIKKQRLKKKAAKETWEKKTDAEKLLAFAQEVKDNLPAFIFACREFDETETAKGGMFRHRRLADCHLNGLFMLDIDHIENPIEIWYKMRDDKELMKSIALVHITSSSFGIRIVGVADLTVGNLADNQIALAQKLGYKADESCIDATRNSFAPKEEDIIYINEELLFDYYNEEFDKKYTDEYRKRTQPLFHQFGAEDEKTTSASNKTTTETTKTTFSGDNMSPQAEVLPEIEFSPCERPEVERSKLSKLSSEKNSDLSSIKWRGYDIQSIIDQRYADKLPCAEDSNRHKESLKLATDLLLMLDGDKASVQRIVEAQPWVQEIINERDENVSQTVASAADCVAQKEKKYASSLPSKAMLEAIQKATGKSYQEITKAQTSAAVTESDIERWLWDWGEQIEGLFDNFPLLRDICKGLKKNQYPAAVFVAGGLLMTLMTRCTYRFYHRPEELRRLNNSTLIIGDPASGKSFATRLFKLLAAPMVAADKDGIAAINRYKEEMKTKGANKEKPQKPKALFRVHPARTSNAQFIQDMVNAVEVVDGTEMQLHMLTFDTELDNTLTVQKGGSWIDKQSMELKAFHNEEDGQAYSNLDSVVQNFIVTWNYIYTGTPMALKKKVNAQNFGSGLATRLTCIPLPGTNFEMMERESRVDFESDERLKTWAFKLDRVKGELSVQKIVDELYDWTARRMADAKENDSKADEMLLKRCAYHGLNFAAPFIVMHHWADIHQDGQFWSGEFETDEVDWRLTELLVNIQYACQRHYFGALAEKYFDDKTRDAAANVQRRAKTVEAFNRLPEEFSTDDMMQCFNLKTIASARVRVYRLLKDGLIEKVDEFVENGTTKAKYKKTGAVMI